MSGKRAIRIYWDTCVFLAWIKRENCWPKDVMDGIEQTIEKWTSGETIIVTSSITMLEVLSSHLSKEQKSDCSRVFSNPKLHMVDVDRRVTGKASVIRQYHDDRVFNTDGSTKSGRVIGMGDAIHLATALNYEVFEFQTLDGAGKRKRKYDLLALNDNVTGVRLQIRLPKFIEPPKFSAGPIEPFGGSQRDLFEIRQQATDTDAIRRIINTIKAAIDTGHFKDRKP